MSELSSGVSRRGARRRTGRRRGRRGSTPRGRAPAGRGSERHADCCIAGSACGTQPRTMRPASRLHSGSYSERNLPALIHPRGGTRRMLLKRTSVAILIAVAASGCTSMRRDRYCKYALPAWGAALGGAGAGLGVSQGSDHASAPEIGGAAAGGILAGGLLGALAGHYFCEEAPVEPPPPPPAPPPPPPPARRR